MKIFFALLLAVLLSLTACQSSTSPAEETAAVNDPVWQTVTEQISPEEAARIDSLLSKLEPVEPASTDDTIRVFYSPVMQLRHLELEGTTLTILVQFKWGDTLNITAYPAHGDIGSTGANTHCGWTADGRSYALMELDFNSTADIPDSITLTTDKATIDNHIVDFEATLTIDLTEVKS